MADFAEQLKLISILREQRNRHDDALYRARLALRRATQQLIRARQKQTIVDADRDRQVAALRSSMAQLEQRLAALREEARQQTQWFAQLAEQNRLVAYLQQNQEAVVQH